MRYEDINQEWLLENLPHGSGIDADWRITRQKNGAWICASFHVVISEWEKRGEGFTPDVFFAKCRE